MKRTAAGRRRPPVAAQNAATANRGLATRVGGQLPAGVNVQALEKRTTNKADVIRHLRAAFASFRGAVEAYPVDAADRTMPWFGPPQISVRHF